MSGNVLLIGPEMDASVQAYLLSQGITSTIISGSALEGTDLSAYTGIWVGWFASVTDSGSLAANLAAFINGGGNILVEPFTNLVQYLPNGGDIISGAAGGGDDVVIVDTTGELMDGITDADLSNWGASYHDAYNLVDYDQFMLEAENFGGSDITLLQTYGQGHIVVTGQDPSYHIKYGDWHGEPGNNSPQLEFVVNALSLEPDNTPPDAVNDDLSGPSGVLNIGYYDMGNGAGVFDQREAIIAAGHNPVLISDLSAAELASIDMLIVQNPDNGGYSAEYLANLANIEAAVGNGLTLIIHDRYVDNAESILPGSTGFTIVRDFTEGTNIDFIDDAHAVTSGLGGILTDASLDGGNFSNHGFAIQGSLPAGADLILSTNNGGHIVTFSYGFGSGQVIYSSIPIDFYLSGDTVGAGANNMFGQAEEYMVNLIGYAASNISQNLTDEDTAAIIDGADLLANDTDLDGDTLVISGVSALSTLGGAVTLTAGMIGYDPSGVLDYLSEGEVVEDSFTYTISDGNGGTDTATVTFKVVGVNDGPTAPVDTDGTAGATLAEDATVGGAVGIDVNATDVEGDTISYYFRDALNVAVQTLGNFTIDASTGVITLTNALNYETATSHNLTVYAGDGFDESSTVFTVTVTNVAPTAPTDSDAGTNVLAENAAAGTYTGVTAASTDPNGATLAYSLTDTAGGRFAIDSVTGAITATGAGNLDYETASVDGTGHYYEVTARANDGTANSGSTTFRIYVSNVVEHLFTPNNDGTSGAPINFNTLPNGAYDNDGAQYNALAGNDFVYLPNIARVDAGHPWDFSRTFEAGAGNDVVQGGTGNDIISGGDGNDRLFGGNGDDRLVGSSGDDILGGGDGSDKLTGSSGKDIFIFTASENGTSRTGEHDVITDFQQGTDKIDLSALYDGTYFGGLSSGSSSQASSLAGHRVIFFSEGGKTWLMGDTDGVAGADFAIEMSGSYKLKGSDVLVGTSIIESQAQWSTATGGLPWAPHHDDNYFI